LTVKKNTDNQDLIERLDKLSHEINQLKSILIFQSQPEKKKSSKAWDNLVKASEEVSDLWTGCSALEEIQTQRGQ
jgi:hypothetical protein